MDKTPQIAEEQLVVTMEKAQETKLQRCVSVFSADISKSEEISRWRPTLGLMIINFYSLSMFYDFYHDVFINPSVGGGL